MQQQEDNGLLLVGTGYVRNRRISGSLKEQVGNLISLKLKATSETKKRISRMKESAGSALDSVTIKDATEVVLGSDTFNKLTLAMALSGKSVEIAAEAKTVTDEVVHIVKKGAWFDLKNQNIDPATVTVKNKDNQKVEAESVVINETLGWVAVKDDAKNVNDDEDIKVSYKTKAGGGLQIDASTENDYDFEFWLDGYNQASNKNFMLHIPSMVVAPNGEIDWLSNEFASAEFAGTVVLADGNTVPYFYKEFNA